MGVKVGTRRRFCVVVVVVASAEREGTGPATRVARRRRRGRTFSAVIGTTSARSVISMRPAGWPPMVMSKKTTGFDMIGSGGGVAGVSRSGHVTERVSRAFWRNRFGWGGSEVSEARACAERVGWAGRGGR